MVLAKPLGLRTLTTYSRRRKCLQKAVLSFAFTLKKHRSDAFCERTLRRSLAKSSDIDQQPSPTSIRIIDQQQFILPNWTSLALMEKAPSVLGTAANLCAHDDINRLIKRLTKSFTTTKGEAHFSIAEGTFTGAHFHLLTNERDLVITVTSIGAPARALLVDNHELLAHRLMRCEINLCGIRFS